MLWIFSLFIYWYILSYFLYNWSFCIFNFPKWDITEEVNYASYLSFYHHLSYNSSEFIKQYGFVTNTIVVLYGLEQTSSNTRKRNINIDRLKILFLFTVSVVYRLHCFNPLCSWIVYLNVSCKDKCIKRSGNWVLNERNCQIKPNYDKSLI